VSGGAAALLFFAGIIVVLLFRAPASNLDPPRRISNISGPASASLITPLAIAAATASSIAPPVYVVKS